MASGSVAATSPCASVRWAGFRAAGSDALSVLRAGMLGIPWGVAMTSRSSAETNSIACPIHLFRSASRSTPSGSTTTQPFIGLPVMSNTPTWGFSNAVLACSGPTRAISESLKTPTSSLPWSRKLSPPNIFFSVMAGSRAKASRVRAAKDSLKSMGALPEAVRGHETDLSGRGLAFHLLSSLDRGQHIRIAGEEPASVGLFAVDRHTIAGKPTFLSVGAWGHGERVPATRVGNVADDHDLHQLADAADPILLVSGSELGREPVP